MMNDIEQYRQLLKGNTDSINTDQIIPKKTNKETNKWTGIVVNNCDPDKLGRVQIKIYGYYDDLALNNLPWAIPDIPSLTNTKGNFIIPELNTIVRGYFDNADELKPVYDSVAFNSAYTDENTNFQDWLIRTEDYPQTMVLFQTDQHDFLIMNRKTGEISFTHHTGAVTRIDSNGNIQINTGTYTNGPGNLTCNIAGKIDLETDSTINIKAQKDVNIDSVGGNVNLGKNAQKQLVNNLPQCLICGAMHCIGNTNVKA